MEPGAVVVGERGEIEAGDEEKEAIKCPAPGGA
jgi:hypothetical protein